MSIEENATPGSTAETSTSSRRIRAPRGFALSCKGWQQEAALRMFMNSLDPEVAEYPEELAVYAGTGKVVRNWQSYDAIVESLHTLGNDETLLVQAGNTAGILSTSNHAPRILISGGSWTHTGTQEILHTTYQVFSAAARKHFGGSLAGKLVVSGGMGGLGGAQPLGATLNGAVFLGIDVDPERIKRRVKAGYCDVMVNDLDESLRILKNAVRKREPASVGLVGNCADIFPVLAERGIVPDLLTDQTLAHDPLQGYVPAGFACDAAAELRTRDPEEYRRHALDSIAAQVRSMLELQKLGAVTFEFGNNSEYLRPILLEGLEPLLWVALSGEPSDIYRADELLVELFPQNEVLSRWIRMIGKRLRFQGLPARTCWLAQDERAKFGLRLNDLVARGELKAPMVIVRDHFNGGLAASRFIETESNRDTSDARADLAVLTALHNIANGETWISIQNGAPLDPSCTQYASHAIVADGTPETAESIARNLNQSMR